MYNNVNKNNDAQLEMKKEIRQTIGEKSNSNVNKEFENIKFYEEMQKYYNKLLEQEKQKEPINWIRNTEEEKKQEEERLKKLKEVKTDNFELKTKKQIEQEKDLKKKKQLADLYEENLKQIKEREDVFSQVENKMSSNNKEIVFSFLDKFYAENEKKGVLDVTILKNNFERNYEELMGAIRIELKKLKLLLKKCDIKINEFYSDKNNFVVKLSEQTEGINEEKERFLKLKKNYINSILLKQTSNNNILEFNIIKEQNQIIHILKMEGIFLKQINSYLKKYFEEKGYQKRKDRKKCYAYLDNKFIDIENLYIEALNGKDSCIEKTYKNNGERYLQEF